MTQREKNCWHEAHGYRSNGRKEEDGSISYIYAKDLNGDSLEILTSKLIEELGLTITIANA